MWVDVLFACVLLDIRNLYVEVEVRKISVVFGYPLEARLLVLPFYNLKTCIRVCLKNQKNTYKKLKILVFVSEFLSICQII